jgi:hypothetical protein
MGRMNAGGVLEILASSSSIRHTVQATATADQFSRFRAGVAELGQGEQTLTAQVVLAPDTEVMRLNAIYLQRIDHD